MDTSYCEMFITLCRVAAPVCYLLYSSPVHHLEEYYTLLYSLDGCRVQTFVDCRERRYCSLESDAQTAPPHYTGSLS